MIPSGEARAGVVEAPAARPLDLVARLDRSAGRSYAYTTGRASGRRLVYGDLSAFAWWRPGGRLTLNRGTRRLEGTMRGVEDVDGRR